MKQKGAICSDNHPPSGANSASQPSMGARRQRTIGRTLSRTGDHETLRESAESVRVAAEQFRKLAEEAAETQRSSTNALEDSVRSGSACGKLRNGSLCDDGCGTRTAETLEATLAQMKVVEDMGAHSATSNMSTPNATPTRKVKARAEASGFRRARQRRLRLAGPALVDSLVPPSEVPLNLRLPRSDQVPTEDNRDGLSRRSCEVGEFGQYQAPIAVPAEGQL